jgi:hypothetical protein
LWSIDPEPVDGLFPKKGVAGIQITIFAMWRYRLPKFKGIVSAKYLSSGCSKPKGISHLFNKRFTADSKALCPLVFFITI